MYAGTWALVLREVEQNRVSAEHVREQYRIMWGMMPPDRAEQLANSAWVADQAAGRV